MKSLLLFFGIASVANFLTTLAENADKAKRFKRAPIVGGNEAGRRDFPYAVAILSSKTYLCSGGIIGERYVLTAMHCFRDSKTRQFMNLTYTVIAGTNNYESSNAIKTNVKQVFTPNDPRWPDIAVLKLAENLNVQKNRLQVLRLPGQHQNIEVDQEGIVAGFGACQVTVSRNGTTKIIESKTFDGKLRYANVKNVDKALCTGTPYRHTEFEDFEFTAKMIRNTTNMYGLCYGDSGSTFVHERDTAIGVYLAGYSKECDGRNLAGSFINVGNFLPFINSVLTGNITEAIRVYNPVNKIHSNLLNKICSSCFRP